MLRNLAGLSGWLSSAGLEEMAVDGILNRHLVLSLQSAKLADPATLAKAKALVAALPPAWPSGAANPAQFQPLAKVASSPCLSFRFPPSVRRRWRSCGGWGRR